MCPTLDVNNMAAALYLKVILDDFQPHFSPTPLHLRQKQMATAFMKDSYVTSMRLYYVGKENIQAKARAFRSQRKTEEPHQVNFTAQCRPCILQLQG